MGIYFPIILVVVSAGFLGGYAAYVLEFSDDGRAPERGKLFRYVVLGIIGAALVPALLEVAAKGAGATGGLVEQVTKAQVPPKDWLVFFGYCLAGGVMSRKFIPRVSEQLVKQALDEAREARREAESARSDVSDLESDLAAAPVKLETATLSQNAGKVLRAAFETGYSRPSPAAIARAGNLNRDDVGEGLSELDAAGFMQRRGDGDDGTERWRIRAWGKDYLIRNPSP